MVTDSPSHIDGSSDGGGGGASVSAAPAALPPDSSASAAYTTVPHESIGIDVINVAIASIMTKTRLIIVFDSFTRFMQLLLTCNIVVLFEVPLQRPAHFYAILIICYHFIVKKYTTRMGSLTMFLPKIR